MTTLNETDMKDLETLEEAERKPELKKTAPATPPVKQIFDAAQFEADMQIGVDLDDEFRKHSGLFARYAALTRQAEAQADARKLARDVTEAKVSKEIRDRLTKEGVKITEKIVEQEVMLDRRYIAAVMAYNEARQIADFAKNVIEGLKHRRDMLVRIAISEHEERRGALRLTQDALDPEAIKRQAHDIAKRARDRAAVEV